MHAAIFILSDMKQNGGRNALILLADLEREMGYKKILPEYDTAEAEELPTGEQLQMTLNGYDLIGTVRIASVGIELPVLHSWTVR